MNIHSKREAADLTNPTDKELAIVWKIIDGMKWGATIKFEKYAPNKPDLFCKACMMWIDSTKNGEITNSWDGFIKKKFFPTEEDKRAEREQKESREWSKLYFKDQQQIK